MKVGDYVLARMKGYSPWPAQISTMTKNGCKANCYFFGANNNGSVDLRAIIPFENAFNVIRLLKCRKLKDFEKGVREVEIINGIPENMSSLREIESIPEV